MTGTPDHFGEIEARRASRFGDLRTMDTEELIASLRAESQRLADEVERLRAIVRAIEDCPDDQRKQLAQADRLYGEALLLLRDAVTQHAPHSGLCVTTTDPGCTCPAWAKRTRGLLNLNPK